MSRCAYHLAGSGYRAERGHCRYSAERGHLSGRGYLLAGRGFSAESSHCCGCGYNLAKNVWVATKVACLGAGAVEPNYFEPTWNRPLSKRLVSGEIAQTLPCVFSLDSHFTCLANFDFSQARLFAGFRQALSTISSLRTRLARIHALPNCKHTLSSDPAEHRIHACQLISTPAQVTPLSTVSALKDNLLGRLL